MLHALSHPRPDAEALIATVRSRGPKDRVPLFELATTVVPLETVLEERLVLDDVTHFMPQLVKYFYNLGYDYIPAGVRQRRRADGPHGFWVHGQGTKPVESWADFEAYPWPDYADADFSEFEAGRAALKDGMTMLGSHFGIFETILGILGYEGLFLAMYDHAEILKAAIDRIGAYKLKVFQTIASMDGVGFLSMGDDLGTTQDVMVNPEFLRTHLWPWYRKIFQAAHDAGKPMMLHSCGKLHGIMDELIDDIKIDAKHSFEETVIPVKEAYDRYGSRIAIMGGVAADAMAKMPVEPFRAYARGIIEHCAGRGNYCFGSGSGILDYTRVENFFALLDIGREYQRR